jgi:hypothetical protein
LDLDADPFLLSKFFPAKFFFFGILENGNLSEQKKKIVGKKFT